MNFEQKKTEYEGKVLLAEKTAEFLEKAFDDMKENAKEQHKKDVQHFEKIKAETLERHRAATNHGHVHTDINAQIEKAKKLGKK
ncbi:MAG: hypothetical protein E7192_03185 [Erysipelotrichaceae bacterium]|nr:hypothetical protein [Erysipelotrichaceae bacterium]